MNRGRCESRPRRRSCAGKTERPSEGAFSLSRYPADHLADDPAHAARAARAALDRLLEAEAPALRASISGDVANALEAYVALLLDANRRLNLTRIVEPEAVARLHLLDALAAVPLLEEVSPERALDIGSGGGVPGMVLAICRPAVAWTLVDSVRRKAEVLTDFGAALGLANVSVLAERAETLGRDRAHRGAYDLVSARACASLPVLAEYALPLLRPGGVLIAWKGELDAEELRDGRAASALLGGEEPVLRPTGIPALGDHRFIVVRKVAPTPDRYPRRPGEPARRPLG